MSTVRDPNRVTLAELDRARCTLHGVNFATGCAACDAYQALLDLQRRPKPYSCRDCGRDGMIGAGVDFTHAPDCEGEELDRKWDRAEQMADRDRAMADTGLPDWDTKGIREP